MKPEVPKSQKGVSLGPKGWRLGGGGGVKSWGLVQMVRLCSLALTLDSVLPPLFSDEHKSAVCVSTSSFVVWSAGPPESNFRSVKDVSGMTLQHQSSSCNGWSHGVGIKYKKIIIITTFPWLLYMHWRYIIKRIMRDVKLNNWNGEAICSLFQRRERLWREAMILKETWKQSTTSSLTTETQSGLKRTRESRWEYNAVPVSERGTRQHVGS